MYHCSCLAWFSTNPLVDGHSPMQALVCPTTLEDTQNQSIVRPTHPLNIFFLHLRIEALAISPPFPWSGVNFLGSFPLHLLLLADGLSLTMETSPGLYLGLVVGELDSLPQHQVVRAVSLLPVEWIGHFIRDSHVKLGLRGHSTFHHRLLLSQPWLLAGCISQHCHQGSHCRNHGSCLIQIMSSFKLVEKKKMDVIDSLLKSSSQFLMKAPMAVYSEE